MWLISGKYSDLLDTEIADFLIYNWESEDYVIANKINEQRYSLEMTFDSNYFRDESIYKFNFSATNEFNTFYREMQAVFAPISCMWWHDKETESYINKRVIEDPSGLRDIDFQFE